MKKIVHILRSATLFSALLFISSCSKESEAVAPRPLAVSQSSNIILPGGLNTLKIGTEWLQGSAVTGLACDVMMILQSHKVKPNGEVDIWKGIVPEGSCRPAEKLVWNTTFHHMIDGVEYTYQIHTVTETDGSISMRTNWNQNTNRED
jgi:hypothetical protein